MDALDVVLNDPARSVLGMDFDGTLSPIVPDPDRAYVHPDSVAALRRITPHLARVAIITGRPVLKAVELGGFDSGEGLDRLVIMGQYGVERWQASDGAISSPPIPEAISAVKEALPGLCTEHGWPEAWIEDKGRAVAVHTRRLSDPEKAQTDLLAPVQALADTYELHLEPGKNVLEIRAPGFDKGDAVRELAAALQPRSFVYAGDDLGDIAAFDAVAELAGEGVQTVLIFCEAGEPSPLSERADLVVDGTTGMSEWLTRLADALESQGRASSSAG